MDGRKAAWLLLLTWLRAAFWQEQTGDPAVPAAPAQLPHTATGIPIHSRTGNGVKLSHFPRDPQISTQH